LVRRNVVYAPFWDRKAGISQEEIFVRLKIMGGRI